ncbi:MAG: hypothetical protein E5Y65_21985 [Mesorhizobium sp.]|nr:hypothetical protein [Mesorhizobium sp.]TIL87789.1 MAG: hypothetical protein E5Y65_21985 [Mesorhizobium sp.]TIM37063.1 MAG: hypothetical protein E5Y61_00970 [Mesorhizobium sp.]
MKLIREVYTGVDWPLLDSFGEHRPSRLMQDQVTEAIYAAIEEVNLQLPHEQRLEKSLQTRFFGPDGSGLDSLGLVNLIVLVEQKVEEHAGKSISLVNDEVMSLSDSPFESVAKLSNFITSQLQS